MIRYCDVIQRIAGLSLSGFCVGWSRPLSPEQHHKLLGGSTHFVVAIEEESKVVGYVTALSDGVSASFIPLLEVLPEYQGRGIGTELMERILKKLDGVANVDLTCDVKLQPFYKRFRMRESHGMVLRR